MRAVCQQRGLLLENCYTFNYAVKCSVHTGDSIVVHYSVGSTNIVIQTFFKDQRIHRYSIDSPIEKLVYAKNWKLFIGDCTDLHLRVYSQNFGLIQEINLSRTVLSIALNETTNEIYTGTIGSVNCWELSHQLQEPLKANGIMKCNISKKEWVISLYMSTHSSFLVAGCQNGVYILDCKTRTQVNYLPNIHRASISCAVLYHPSQYLITAAMDGTIKVSSSVLNTEFVMSMKPMGHLQQITGLGLHPDYPFLISTSIDGNIRVWDLKSFTEYCSCHFASPVLTLTVTQNGSIISSCRNEVSLFKLNRVETFLSSLHSEVETISTVRERNQSTLVMTDDGSARLLSTTTGLCITIMFPLYTPSIVTDIVHNISDSLLYVLTNTGEILTFTTTTNPCSARQLWYPKTSEECVSCITMVQNDRHAVLVGGHASGSLSVLYNGGHPVPAPYYAHGRSIAQLVSSQHFEVSMGEDNEIGATVATYGVEELIQIWLLKVRRLDYREEQCWMQKILNISVDFVPSFMGTTTSCLALATSEYGIHTLHIPSLVDSSTQVTVIEDPVFTTSQSEDVHCNQITSFSMHQTLDLIATSSEDNKIKVWDYSCDLVAEIDMGLTVSSLCFITRGADLLIGFNEQLGIITGKKLLPLSHLSQLKEFPAEAEIPLKFDNQLEFWYDRKRVPSFPVSEANLFNLKNDTRLTPIQQQLLNEIEMELSSSDKLVSTGEMMPKLILDGEEKMAVQKKVAASGVRSLKSSYGRRMKRLSLVIQHEEDKDEIDLMAVLEDGNFYSEQISPDLANKTHLVEDPFVPILTMFSSSKVSMKQICNPSSEHFIAPDGLIPNSVIRKHFRPILSDLLDSQKDNELAKFNVEERLMRKLMSKVKLSKMKHWFSTSSSDEDWSMSSYSPKPRAKWNWDDDDLSSTSSGEENRFRKRNKKGKKRVESPLSFQTADFAAYKNSMTTSDMMESAYIFRNRRSRNKGKQLPPLTNGNRDPYNGEIMRRPSKLPPTFEDSLESFDSSPELVRAHSSQLKPISYSNDQPLSNGRSSVMDRLRGRSSTSPPLSTPSLMAFSSVSLRADSPPLTGPVRRTFPKKQFEQSETETKTFTKRVKSTFKFKGKSKRRGGKLNDEDGDTDSEESSSEEEEEEDDDQMIEEDSQLVDEDILLLPDGKDSLINLIDNVRESLLRERSIEDIPGVLSADDAFDFLRKQNAAPSDNGPPKPYNSQPDLTIPVAPAKKSAPFIPKAPLKLWGGKKKSVATVVPAKQDKPLQPPKRRQSIPKPKTQLEIILEEISESPWYPQRKSRQGGDRGRQMGTPEGTPSRQTGLSQQGTDIGQSQQLEDRTGQQQQHQLKERILHTQQNPANSFTDAVPGSEVPMEHHKERGAEEIEKLPPNQPPNTPQALTMNDTLLPQQITLNSVLGELMHLLKSANSFVYSQVCHAIEKLLEINCMSIQQKTDLALALASRLEDNKTDNSTSIKLNSLKLIENLNVRSPVVVKAILPLLTDKNEKIKETAFITLNKLTGMATRNDLQTIMIDIGLLRDTKQDEEEALRELENRLRQKLCRSSSQFTSYTISNESSFDCQSSLYTDTSLDEHEDGKEQQVKTTASNPNQPTVLQIDRLPSQDESRPFTTAPAGHSGFMPSPPNMVGFTQSDETRMKILEMYGADFHSSKHKNKHLMGGMMMDAPHGSSHMFNRAAHLNAPGVGVGSRWMSSQAGPGLQGIGSKGLELGSHWAGQHAMQSVHQRFNRAGNAPAGHGLQAAYRATTAEGGNKMEQRTGGNLLPPIQPGNNSTQQQQQPGRSSYGEGLKLPPLLGPRRSGGPGGLNMPPSLMNGTGPSAMEMQAMQVQGWTPNHDQFEWGNMNVLLHNKYKESFSDIIWSDKESPDPTPPA